jgi:hypothetical protein
MVPSKPSICGITARGLTSRILVVMSTVWLSGRAMEGLEKPSPKGMVSTLLLSQIGTIEESPLVAWWLKEERDVVGERKKKRRRD